jgi:hypothetical protein
MSYTYPNIGDNKVIYKGKRYWIIDLIGKDTVDGFGRDFCEMLFYDKLYGAVIATINRNENGKFTASLISHVELTYELNDLTELAQLVPVYADAYSKYCGG